MATGPNYVVKYRRRRENKTDYRKRLRLLKSEKPRLVARRSLNNFIAQIVIYDKEKNQDKVLIGVHSKILEKFGWKYHRGNLPSAYLTGLIIGKLALMKGINEAIFDIGRHKSTKGNSLYALLKGAVDAGLKINYSEDIMPSEDRIRGEHIANYAKLLKKENPDKFKRQFSRYLSLGLDPENIPKDFEIVKNNILRWDGKKI